MRAMDNTRFEAIIAAYGADPSRWPDAERADAQRFAPDADMALALREAREVDRILDCGSEQIDVTLLSARVLKRFRSSRTLRALTSPSSPSFWAMAVSAAVGLALGFGAGAAAPAANVQSMQVLSTAFQSPYDVAEDLGG
jgi:hypothetical protein